MSWIPSHLSAQTSETDVSKIIVNLHVQFIVNKNGTCTESPSTRVEMQKWRGLQDYEFHPLSDDWHFAFTNLKLLFPLIKKHTVFRLWVLQKLRKSTCKRQPTEDTYIIYFPRRKGTNQINYFCQATADRLTSAFVTTIKFLGGRSLISQFIRLVILASETIKEQ